MKGFAYVEEIAPEVVSTKDGKSTSLIDVLSCHLFPNAKLTHDSHGHLWFRKVGFLFNLFIVWIVMRILFY